MVYTPVHDMMLTKFHESRCHRKKSSGTLPGTNQIKMECKRCGLIFPDFHVLHLYYPLTYNNICTHDFFIRLLIRRET